MLFLLLINVKMQTIVGILTFMSRKNLMLSWVEHEKSFITSGPVCYGKWVHFRRNNSSIFIFFSWPGCSKLTMSLVNVSLKFQMLISEIWKYFSLKKCEKLCKSFSHFFNKKISVFGCKVVKHLTSWPLNELVKLTMLWTTGPWSPFSMEVYFLKNEFAPLKLDPILDRLMGSKNKVKEVVSLCKNIRKTWTGNNSPLIII